MSDQTDNPSRDERARLREIFLSEDRIPEVIFFTTNLEKYLQARLVFERSGLFVRHFKSRTDPYTEDYSGSKEHLLSRAIEEVTSTLGRSSFLFIEDTSVRIEALSTSTLDFPGLAVKEWFARTSFEELDKLLKQNNNDRRAVVKSGIALHVPGLNHPVFFNGETVGRVAHSAPSFDESRNYPWLTPFSFNGWFVPDGTDLPLGALSIDESWRYDFRVRSLTHLIDRLEEYTAALNVPSQAYRRRHRSQRDEALPLFPSTQPVVIVVGLTCAGKTTFGDFARRDLNCQVIEASSVVRMLGDQRERQPSLFEEAITRPGIVDAALSTDPAEQAKQVLSVHGVDAVARRILDAYSAAADTRGLVITGFRLVEELDTLKEHLPSAKIVLIQASEKTRFERLLRRNRRDADVQSLDAFKLLDEKQREFGLLRVAEDFADVRIVNEGSIEEFENQVKAVLSQRHPERIVGVATDLQPRVRASRNQVYRCLAILAKDRRPFTTDEIEAGTAVTGRRILQNNVNKVLKRVPELATRLTALDSASRVRYEITSAGLAYVRLVEQHLHREEAILPDR